MPEYALKSPALMASVMDSNPAAVILPLLLPPPKEIYFFSGEIGEDIADFL
jgi:hypothetical protein